MLAKAWTHNVRVTGRAARRTDSGNVGDSHRTNSARSGRPAC
jgi:hypothetical protein